MTDTCPICNDTLIEGELETHHESTGMVLCHVEQEAEQERITAHLEDLRQAERDEIMARHAEEQAAGVYDLPEPDPEPEE